MTKARAVLVVVTARSAAAAVPAIAAVGACVPANASVPAGANTTDPKAPFFIDTAGLDLKTTPPTRDPRNPNYPQATELPDGQVPSVNSDGNFIIGRDASAVARGSLPRPMCPTARSIPSLWTRQTASSTGPAWFATILPGLLELGGGFGMRLRSWRQIRSSGAREPCGQLESRGRRLCAGRLCPGHGSALHRVRRWRRAQLLQGSRCCSTCWTT
jgi:hypothetical protein